MIDQKVAELAESLGRTMRQTQASADFRQARKQAAADPDAQALLKAYQQHMELLARKQQENKPIEVDDKHKLRDFREKMAGNEKLKVLIAAEAEYWSMIHQVNEILGKHLSGDDQAKPKA